ncbi:MAG: hypothetical protein ACP6IP_00370 [Candidatus Njordarchaeia archaeon]
MQKKTLALLLALALLITTIIYVPTHGTFQSNAFSTGNQIYLMQMDNETIIPLVNITLSNGSVLNFTTVDDAMRYLYNQINSGKLTLSNITNVTVLYFEDYIGLLSNETNITAIPIPAYETFFVRLPNPEDYNYTGKYIPTKVDGIIKYGNALTRSILYGKVGPIEYVDINNNNHTSSEFASHDINVLLFYNSRYLNASLWQLTEIQSSMDNLTSMGVNVIAIDLNNNATLANEIKSKYNLTMTITLNNETYAPERNVTGVYKLFGFENITPSTVYMDGNGYVLRKHMGVEDINSILVYVKLMKKGPIGLAQYPILDIYIEEPREDTASDVVISLGDGFGEISKLEGTYQLVYSNGTVSENKTLNLKSSDGVTFRDAIYIPNDTKSVIIYASLISEYGNYSYSVVIQVEQTPRKEKKQEFPYEMAIIAVILVIVIALGAFYYKRIE